MKLAKSIFIISLASLVAACGGKKEAVTKEEKTETKIETDTSKHEEGEIISLTVAQMNAVGIETGRLEQRNLTAVVRATGKLVSPPQNKAEVNVLFGGIIQRINVLEGQNVRRGQTVAVLENADFIKLQQDYLAAKNGFSYTAAEYKRQQELKAADAGTGKVYQQAEANYRAEQSRLAGYEKQLQQVGISPAGVARGNIARQISVVAPISGTVGRVTVSTGTYVQPGTPLMNIVNGSTVYAELTVFEKDLFKIRNGQDVRMMLSNQSGQEIYGEIYGVNKSFESETKSITVYSTVKTNKHNLVPGIYVTALINIGQESSPSVPEDALVRSAGKDYIFVQVGEAEGEERSFRKVEVVLGVTELDFTQITAVDELPEDAIIVTKGAYYVLSITQGGEEEEGEEGEKGEGKE